jgi:muconolactone delta-isomerase
MLYQVTFDIDRQALGFGENAMKVRTAETERAVKAQQEGKLIGLWRRADCGGVVFILDVESHEALFEELSSLPIFPYVRSIGVVPLIAYPRFPECAKGQKPSSA